MPAYDYKCERGHVREVLHKMTETPEVVCEEVFINAPLPDHPEVGYETRCGLPMKRQFSAPAVTYGCTGFYATDSRIVRTASDVHGTGL